MVRAIDNAPKTLKSIHKVEVLEKPRTSLVGLKWRETRPMFGKTATEVMWITDAQEASHYETRAESHGAIYKTRVAVQEQAAATRLRLDFKATPAT